MKCPKCNKSAQKYKHDGKTIIKCTARQPCGYINIK